VHQRAPIRECETFRVWKLNVSLSLHVFFLRHIPAFLALSLPAIVINADSGLFSFDASLDLRLLLIASYTV
jgi:hypothetical protein